MPNVNTSRILLRILCAAALVAGVAAVPARMVAQQPYHVIAKWNIGGDGGWDYLAVDQDARRLYVSHATKVVVIDIDKDAVVGEVTDTPGVHGIATAPKLGLGFTSNGRENKSSVFDLKTLKTTMKVDTGENPDAILYDPSSMKIFCFNHGSGDVTMVDPAAPDAANNRFRRSLSLCRATSASSTSFSATSTVAW